MSRPLHVLIVDDRRPTRQGLTALLGRAPGVVVAGEAGDGLEAVRFVAAHRPDVVVMDLQMPRVDGLEATRRIKSRWPEVQVVVLTLHAGLREEALAAGADAFLVKGSPAEGVREAVLKLVERGRAR